MWGRQQEKPVGVCGNLKEEAMAESKEKIAWFSKQLGCDIFKMTFLPTKSTPTPVFFFKHYMLPVIHQHTTNSVPINFLSCRFSLFKFRKQNSFVLKIHLAKFVLINVNISSAWCLGYGWSDTNHNNIVLFCNNFTTVKHVRSLQVNSGLTLEWKNKTQKWAQRGKQCLEAQKAANCLVSV